MFGGDGADGVPLAVSDARRTAGAAVLTDAFAEYGIEIGPYRVKSLAERVFKAMASLPPEDGTLTASIFHAISRIQSGSG